MGYCAGIIGSGNPTHLSWLTFARSQSLQNNCQQLTKISKHLLQGVHVRSMHLRYVLLYGNFMLMPL